MGKVEASVEKAAKGASKTRDYVATVSGWVAGRRVKEGATIQLTDKQAQHEHVVPARKGRAKK